MTADAKKRDFFRKNAIFPRKNAIFARKNGLFLRKTFLSAKNTPEALPRPRKLHLASAGAYGR